MKKLENCPFCGGQAIIRYNRTKRAITPFGEEQTIPVGTGYWTIGCTTTDCILYYEDFGHKPRLMFVSGTKDEMIRRWNRRANEERGEK